MHTMTTPINSRADTSALLHSQNLTYQFMSSRDIADLVDSRHDDVKRSIARLADRGVIQLPPLAEVKNHLGQTVSEYQIAKRDTYIIVAQLSPEFTAALVDRWQALESQSGHSGFSIPRTKAEALRLAADLEDQNEKLSLIIIQQAPKVAAIKRLAAAHGAVCLTDAAKLLQVKPRQFIEWMLNRDWLYQRGKRKRLAANQERIDQGLMTHKVTELKPDELTGESQAVAQPLVTPKGLARLAEMLQEAL